MHVPLVPPPPPAPGRGVYGASLGEMDALVGRVKEAADSLGRGSTLLWFTGTAWAGAGGFSEPERSRENNDGNNSDRTRCSCVVPKGSDTGGCTWRWGRDLSLFPALMFPALMSPALDVPCPWCPQLSLSPALHVPHPQCPLPLVFPALSVPCLRCPLPQCPLSSMSPTLGVSCPLCPLPSMSPASMSPVLNVPSMSPALGVPHPLCLLPSASPALHVPCSQCPLPLISPVLDVPHPQCLLPSMSPTLSVPCPRYPSLGCSHCSVGGEWSHRGAGWGSQPAMPTEMSGAHPAMVPTEPGGAHPAVVVPTLPPPSGCGAAAAGP